MENNHAYLKLPKILVDKNKVGYLLDRYDKIETHKNINKHKDVLKIRIQPYLYIKIHDLCCILGNCNNYRDLNIPVLTGVQSTTNTISYKTVVKLKEIEKDRNINLGISKDILNKIQQFTKNEQ